jgi:hypothetical protein
MRSPILLLTTLLPGFGFSLISTFYLFPEWIALDKAHRNFQQVAASNPTIQQLIVAQSAENRHRINCFAEGMGVLLGGVIGAIGIHGLTRSESK